MTLLSAALIHPRKCGKRTDNSFFGALVEVTFIHCPDYVLKENYMCEVVIWCRLEEVERQNEAASQIMIGKNI